MKSRLWAATIWRASWAVVAVAWSLLGICTTLPARRRLTLPLTKAFGLARSMATSIWSSETPEGRWALASCPAVSPARTVTLPLLAAALAGADAGAAATGAAPSLLTVRPVTDAGAGAGRLALICGAFVGAGGVACGVGAGSSSRV